MKLRDETVRLPWKWPIAVYALNFAIIWMVSFVQQCTQPDVVPRICEATRPLSHIGVLLMIGVPVAFPAMLTLVAAIWLGRRQLCFIYCGGISAIAAAAFIFYRSGYFAPGEDGCPACNVVFLVQVGFNLLWLIALLPGGLVLLQAWAKDQSRPR